VIFTHVLKNIINFILEKEIMSDFIKLSFISDMKKDVKRIENLKSNRGR